MALTRPFPIDQAYPNASDLRKQLSAIYPREGVFPDPITANPAAAAAGVAGVAYGNGGWNVGANPCVLATKRGGAPYTQAYGTALESNDAAGTAWTIAPAPASGTRVDRLWIKALDPGQGDALDSSTPPRAVPAYGITAGTPGIQPLPAGCVEIAQVSTPSTATSIAQSTITQTYDFAFVSGGLALFRNYAALSSWSTAPQGQRALDLETRVEYERGIISGAAAWVHVGGVVTGTMTRIDANVGITTYSLKKIGQRTVLRFSATRPAGFIHAAQFAFTSLFPAAATGLVWGTAVNAANGTPCACAITTTGSVLVYFTGTAPTSIAGTIVWDD